METQCEYLLSIVDEFLDEGWRDISESVTRSDGKCKWASLALLNRFAAYGVEADLVCLSEDYKDAVTPTTFHFIVRVGDLSIDVTARQFNSEAEVPLILDFDSAARDYDSVEVVNPDDPWHQRTHEVPSDWKSLKPSNVDEFARRQRAVR